MPRIIEMLDNVTSKHEALSNRLRLLILTIVIARQRASWTDIVADLKSCLQKDVNPNSVSFHLKKLQETGFVKVSGSEYEPDQAAKKFQAELQPLVGKIRGSKN